MVSQTKKEADYANGHGWSQKAQGGWSHQDVNLPGFPELQEAQKIKQIKALGLSIGKFVLEQPIGSSSVKKIALESGLKGENERWVI